ncbi:hypothetical protein GON26_20255 [Flavobacterium sp. GA093]|uniref:Uncharacterized protein n=1 Tax=Flavobacterium hydrocarbonoxydans TaxID=2683249 RepID=A0A6I4NR56_9FLAO|nr:hypothetical protein [Flavobacterium hydrocarbonoxydans]MWB96703.1 hypothetical protein [Flavobacterium hydrocarbonoxydans]
MKIIYKISKIVQSILRTNPSKQIANLIQNQTIKLKHLKGEIHSGGSNSLLFQMYAHEEEDLFI